MVKKKKKKTKKIKYKKITFKLSSKQISIVDKCSKLQNTTRNKFIKSAIKNSILTFADRLKDESIITKNQLKLFNFDKLGEQIEMFEEEETDKK